MVRPVNKSACNYLCIRARLTRSLGSTARRWKTANTRCNPVPPCCARIGKPFWTYRRWPYCSHTRWRARCTCICGKSEKRLGPSDERDIGGYDIFKTIFITRRQISIGRVECCLFIFTKISRYVYRTSICIGRWAPVKQSLEDDLTPRQIRFEGTRLLRGTGQAT